MFRVIVPAFAAVALALPAAGWAQSPEELAKQLPQKIHDKLVAEGFTDVKVVPGSYVVSGKDKDGTPIVMLIGPNGMTMMKGVKEENPSTARQKGGDQIIQQ